MKAIGRWEPRGKCRAACPPTCDGAAQGFVLRGEAGSRGTEEGLLRANDLKGEGNDRVFWKGQQSHTFLHEGKI